MDTLPVAIDAVAVPSVPSASAALSAAGPVRIPCPPLDTRWVHAGAQQLDLLPTPVTSASTSYKAFSPDESDRIEERWESMSSREREGAISDWGRYEGEGAPAKVEQKAKETAKNKKDIDSSKKDEGIETPPKIEEVRSGEEQPRGDKAEGEVVGDDRYREVMTRLQKDNDNLEVISGVPVSQDSLFEVDLPTLSLHPVFWAHTGPRVSVMRGSWFLSDETRPCAWELADEIEKAYQEIQPWQPSYKDELATAISIGASAEDKLKRSLPGRFGQGLAIIFDNGERGRLLTNGTMTYLSRAFWSSLGSKSSGTHVYRGYTAAVAASGKDKSGSTSRRGSNASQRSQRDTFKKNHDRNFSGETVASNASSVSKSLGQATNDLLGTDEKKEEKEKGAGKEQNSGVDNAVAMEEEVAPVVGAQDDDPPCTDLILVIHGIGQQLATQYESYNFVYAGNQLRQNLRKQSLNPALASIIRDRRCQVLPVQWRASLILDEEKSAEDRKHSMDNRFTMADLTINKSIPYVRELTNSVLLDIPLFMSHHREKMIEAVCRQANKLFRLWIARNPDFEKRGRVHIIGHSLGAALAAHILSNQPTKMPPLSQLPRPVITRTRDRFLFNTSNLFLCGSPLGVFLHLDQAQLMPRKGRERTMNSPQDEALDRSGKFGCLSIDSLYNIFYYTDPIAYKLNAAVDVKLAAQRPPLAITAVTAPFYTAVTEGLGNISRYLPTYLGGSTNDKKLVRPGAIRLPSGIEMSGPDGEEKLEGSRGERRFSALNPHGNLDFYLPSAGVSEYLDMITAHASYWADASFAAFLLAETFSSRLDLIRTGLGLASGQIVPE